MAFEVLHEEQKPLVLIVSFTKTKVSSFGNLMGDCVNSVHACGGDIEVSQSFVYLSSLVYSDG